MGLLRPGDEIAIDLRTLTTRRLDLVFDRTRRINRLRAQVLEIFPMLERSLDLTNKGPMMLLTGYQAPAAVRRTGMKHVETSLKNRKVKVAAALARTVVEAAQAQHTALPGEKLAAAMVVRLAKTVMGLDEEIAELDALIEARLHEHPHAEVIRSLPGMGIRLTAEFIAATGGDMDTFASADRLAGFAGLVPQPRDSGRVNGNMRTPLPPRATQDHVLVGDGQPQVLPRLQDVLPTEAERGERPQAGSPRAGPPSHQRLVGNDP